MKTRPAIAVVRGSILGWWFIAGGLVAGADPSSPSTTATARGSLGRAGEFELSDPQGKLHTPKAWRDAKAVVLFFLGTECPVSNGYSPEMQRLNAKFSPRGVLFYGIHCDPDVTPAAAAEHAKEYSLPFTLLMDPAQVLARQVGARVTPDAIVLGPDGEVAYRGRLDNRYAESGKRRLEATQHDLEEAIDAVLAGRMPATRETKAFGCPLPRLTTARPDPN
jgi:peroxiredoxin